MLTTKPLFPRRPPCVRLAWPSRSEGGPVRRPGLFSCCVTARVKFKRLFAHSSDCSNRKSPAHPGVAPGRSSFAATRRRDSRWWCSAVAPHILRPQWVPCASGSSLALQNRRRLSPPLAAHAALEAPPAGADLLSDFVLEPLLDPQVLVDRMTVGPEIHVSNGDLLVHGHKLLSGVPSNIICSQNGGSWGVPGVFLGGASMEAKSRHVFTLGTLRGHRFLCCFRFKLWWMTQRMGDRGCEIPGETQFMLVETSAPAPLLRPPSAAGEGGEAPSTTYTIFLPLLDGAFRASLQGTDGDELQFIAESGDPGVKTAAVLNAIYVAAGTNPYDVISDAVRAVEAHSMSFVHREKKKLPGMLDCFGWCTWDAFYTDVTAEGVHRGLSSLSAGGAPAKFLIIDDGWQSVATDEKPSAVPASITAGTQYASRLTDIKENAKFKRPANGGGEVMDPLYGIGNIVQEAKAAFDLKYVYVWHALMGYWGGVQPGGKGTHEYESALVYPVHTPGVLANQPDMAADSITLNGLGVVHPQKAFHFYDQLHSYLAGCGIDGVKVDVQNVLETVAAGFGGRVVLAKQYHDALERSILKNFPDNGIISCMSHNTDGLYSAKQTAVVRASDDFWPRDPASHTIHIASVAYNTLFLGEFMQPDWDMFHSLHPVAEYHAAARAVGGCAVYVSDKPGEHDFDILRKLVLPDGTVLRARLPGRPTRDCLFTDPARDKASVLKIWNVNSCTGLVGAFNCQGAGWCKVGKKYLIHDPAPDAVSGSLRAADVEGLRKMASGSWNGDVAVYAHRSQELVRLPRGAALPFTLTALQYELFTVAPIEVLSLAVSFAPIGLSSMFNSGGAIIAVEYQGGQLASGTAAQSSPVVNLIIKGCGTFTAFSSSAPRCCFIDGVQADFVFDASEGRLSAEVPFEEGRPKALQFAF